MAALGSQSIASSYEQLLHVDRDEGGNTTTHVSVKDGDNGTTFALTLATDAVMITSTNRLEFGDDGTYIFQSADGVLDLVSDTEIEINATTIDINGATDLSGDLTLAGDIVFNAAGKGICLGVTSNTDANTLDDYEEGDHTVTVTCSTSGNYTLGDDTLAYTKVGRLCHVQGSISVTGENSPNGDIRISLPFTTAALSEAGDYSQPPITMRNHGDTHENVSAAIGSNAAFLSLYNITDAGVLAALTHSDVDTAFDIYISLTFIAA
jgi:hypothetical protein